jgi:hypothetical protein
MTLLDRFRRRPDWEHEDPLVRAEAVRAIPLGDQDLLIRLAQGDADPRVRRAAARRIQSVSVLAAVASADADATVREESVARLLEIAHGHDEASAREATAGIEDPRQLANVVRGSGSAAVRLLAVARIREERTLATLAKTSDDPAVRREALGRVAEAGLLADVAAKSEHKDVATAAVERIDDAALLAGIAERARNRGAARKAKARLELLRPAALPAPESAPQPHEAPAPEAAPVPASQFLEPAVQGAAPELAAVVEAAAPVEAAVPVFVATAVPVAQPPSSPRQGQPGASAEEAAARAAGQETHEKERLARVAQLDALLARLEALAQAEQLTLKDAEAALREAREARAELAQVPARLAQKLKAARAELFAKTQPLREAEDWTRWSNAAIQEQLCERIEALVPRENFEKVARDLHDCDARWSEARHAPKEEAEGLRRRYQAARAQVKGRVDAWFARKAATEKANLKQKEALCEKAEALAESTEWIKTADALKALQVEWKSAGSVPHRASERVWKRFRTACDRFFSRRQEDLKHRKEEWSANLQSKLALCERAEALAASSEWEAGAAEIKKLQADWKAIGAVKKSRADEVWQRFRKACDAFFERYKRRDEIATGQKRAEREALCAELEALLPSAPGGQAPEALAGIVTGLQVRARHASGLAPAEEQALAQRFQDARNKLVDRWPEAFRGSDLDPEVARARRQKLVARVEALAAEADSAREEGQLTGETLARRLKEALAANTMGGAAEADARRRAQAEEVESARAAWKRLGHVPGELGAELEARFETACARFQALPKPPARRAQSRVGAGIG